MEEKATKSELPPTRISTGNKSAAKGVPNEAEIAAAKQQATSVRRCCSNQVALFGRVTEAKPCDTSAAAPSDPTKPPKIVKRNETNPRGDQKRCTGLEKGA